MKLCPTTRKNRERLEREDNQREEAEREKKEERGQMGAFVLFYWVLGRHWLGWLTQLPTKRTRLGIYLQGGYNLLQSSPESGRGMSFVLFYLFTSLLSYPLTRLGMMSVFGYHRRFLGCLSRLGNPPMSAMSALIYLP